MDSLYHHASILNLPVEILVHTFRNLDALSLLHLRPICRAFRELVDSSKELRYIIELHSDGLTSAPCNTLHCSSERTYRLLQLRQSWGKLQPRGYSHIPEVHNQIEDNRLHCGILAQFWQEGLDRAKQFIKFTVLPQRRTNATTHKTPHTWTINLPHYSTISYVMDASQDLLVVMYIPIAPSPEPLNFKYIALCVLSMSRGTRHTFASQETITYDLVPRQASLNLPNHLGGGMQIQNNLLGVVHRFEAGRFSVFSLSIWDWKLGSRIMNISCDGIEDFAFLSDDYILIAFLKCPWPELRNNRKQGCLVVCDIRKSSVIQETKDNAISVVCELSFPTLMSYSRMSEILISSNTQPSMGGPPESIRMATFYPSPESRLFAITTSIHMVGWRSLEVFTFIVPSSTFQTQIQNLKGYSSTIAQLPAVPPIQRTEESSCLPPSHITRIPWRDWGPDGSQCFICTNLLFSRCIQGTSMSGSRFVVPMPEATCRVEIFDFNGKMLKRRECDATMNGNQETRDRCAEIVGHENSGSDEQEPGHKDLMKIFEVKQTVTDLLPHSYSGRLARKQHAFEEEFEVHLPFMHTAIHLDREASDVMISEEHLVIRHASGTSGEGDYTIFSF